MIKMCITEVAFSDMGYGPEFNRQIVFNTPLGKCLKKTDWISFLILDDTLKQIDNEAVPNRMHKRLEAAIGAKQEAIVMQNTYYKKMIEFKNEAEKLRKHVLYYINNN